MSALPVAVASAVAKGGGCRPGTAARGAGVASRPPGGTAAAATGRLLWKRGSRGETPSAGCGVMAPLLLLPTGALAGMPASREVEMPPVRAGGEVPEDGCTPTAGVPPALAPPPTPEAGEVPAPAREAEPPPGEYGRRRP